MALSQAISAAIASAAASSITRDLAGLGGGGGVAWPTDPITLPAYQAWDRSTLSATSSASEDVGSDQANPTGLWMNADGTVLSICGRSPAKIQSWVLTTPFLLSSRAGLRESAELDADMIGLYFSPQGEYVSWCTGNKIAIAPLSTPWDPSSMGAITKTAGSTLPGGFTNAIDIWWADDGLRAYVTSGPTSDGFYATFGASTAWDLSTLSGVGSFNFKPAQVNAVGGFINARGAAAGQLWGIKDDATLFQYTFLGTRNTGNSALVGSQAMTAAGTLLKGLFANENSVLYLTDGTSGAAAIHQHNWGPH